MFTGAINQALSRKCRWLRTLIPVGLGAMVLSVLFLLPGCGSDSNSGGSLKGKNEKTIASGKATKMQGVNQLLTDKQGEMGKVAHKSDSQCLEVFPGITQAELEAKVAADRARIDPKHNEAFPGSGMTVAEMEAKVAAHRANSDPRFIPLPPMETTKKKSN